MNISIKYVKSWWFLDRLLSLPIIYPSTSGGSVVIIIIVSHNDNECFISVTIGYGDVDNSDWVHFIKFGTSDM